MPAKCPGNALEMPWKVCFDHLCHVYARKMIKFCRQKTVILWAFAGHFTFLGPFARRAWGEPELDVELDGRDFFGHMPGICQLCQNVFCSLPQPPQAHDGHFFGIFVGILEAFVLQKVLPLYAIFMPALCHFMLLAYPWHLCPFRPLSPSIHSWHFPGILPFGSNPTMCLFFSHFPGIFPAFCWHIFRVSPTLTTQVGRVDHSGTGTIKQ